MGSRPWLLWICPLICGSALIAFAGLQKPLAQLPAGDAALHKRLGRAMRAREAGFRREALRKFPGDPWSQGDHFSALERRFVRDNAKREGVRPGAVLDAIDRDVKAAPDAAAGRGRVAACMPRPFYD